MDKSTVSMAQQIAQAASIFEKQRTGIEPTTVSVVLVDETLVVSLRGALSKVEKSFATTPQGASHLQQFHRELFNSSMEPMRQEIERITGVPVREASVEVEPASGAVAQVFPTGTMVQVFLLAGKVSAESWSSSDQLPGPP